MGAKRLWLSLVVAVALGCDDGPRGGGGDSCDDCDPLPEFEMPTMGEAAPPALATMLSDDPVLEQGSLAITGSGDTLTLSNGFALTIPPGALPSGTTVDVYRHPFTAADADGGQEIYRIESTAELASAASLTFPIPGAAPAETIDPNRAFVLFVHETDPMVVFKSATVDGVANTITVQAPQFSVFIPSLQRVVAASALPDKVTRVPYYHQRATQNCWSISMMMLMNAYGAHVEPWHNNAFFGIATEHGLPWTSYMHSNDIVEHIGSTVVGPGIERRSWWNLDGTDDTRVYLANNMRAGRPTMVFYYADEAGSDSPHMVLFVGIEGDEFVIHDPSVNGYVRKTWAEITPRFKAHGVLDLDWAFAPDGVGTLAFDTAATDTPWDATVLLPHTINFGEGLSFAHRNEKNDGWEPDKTRAWAWYVPALKGPALLNPFSLKQGGITLDHRTIVTLGVANNVDGSKEVDIDVGMELLAGGMAVGSPLTTSVKVAGGKSVDAVLAAVKGNGEPVRSLVDKPGSYTARFWVAKGGTRYDTAEVPLVIGDPQNCRELLGPTFVFYGFEGTASGTVGGESFQGYPVSPQLLESEDPLTARFNVTWYDPNDALNNVGFFACDGPLGPWETLVPSSTVPASLPFETSTCTIYCRNPETSELESVSTPSGTVAWKFSQDCKGVEITADLSATTTDGTPCGFKASAAASFTYGY